MYYDKNTVIYFNGEFVKAIEAKCDLYSQSLHYGYAVFEGIRAYDTHNGVKIFKAKEHFERMQFSCGAVGIPYRYNNEELIDISYQVLVKNGLRNAYLRPVVICAPNMALTKAKDAQILISAWEWGAYLGEKLLKLKTSSYRRISPASFMVEAKVSGHYINSIMATQEAKDLGFDEALLLDVNGFIAEGPGANVFIEKNGSLFTPQKGSILPGITRATVIEICQSLEIELIEKQITPKEVYDADSAFYCGTAAEIIGIESLDKKPFKKQWSDSLGAIIQKTYKNLVLEKDQAAAGKVA
jgi:branched-chain amino acid aminotransferase